MSSDVSSVKRILSSKYTAIVVLLIASIGVYLNTLPNEFVYDDKAQVLENQWIRDVKNIPEIFLSNVWAFEGSVISNYYRPLMHIIYMIDYHIFGLKPWGFHLTNIIFHAGVTLLVFLIASILINQSRDLNFKSKIPNPTSQILSPAFIAALLFATHPIHTEAVTWASGIPELLFTLFYLLSFYLYTKAEKIWGKQFFLSLLFFFLAALCKEPALTLPILLLVYDYSISRSSVYSSRFTVHTIIKRYLPYLIVSITYFILRTYALGGFAPQPKRHAQLSNYEYFINVFPLFIRYLEKLLLPINMNAFYVFHPISSLFEWKGIITFILTLTFISLIYFFRRNRMIFFSFLWIVISLLPVLYIPVLGENTFTDRYLYLPSIGFVILVSLSIERIYHQKIFRQATNPLIVIVSILIITIGLYSVGTIKRNYIWQDDLSLWTDTVKKSPDSSLAHNNLGFAYSDRNLVDNAIKHYQTALELKPEYPEAHNNLGISYYSKGQIDKAIEHFQSAIRLDSDFPHAYYNLGNAYYIQGRFDNAIEKYLTGLKMKPDDAKAHNNIGRVYYAQGRFDEAIEHYQIAVKLKPYYEEAIYNLGLTYYEKGEIDKAIEHYEVALKLKPNSPEIHNNLGSAFYSKKLIDKAIEHYQIALRLKPDYYSAHYNLGNAYFALGKLDEAIKEYLIVLKLNPQDAEVHKYLGDAYVAQRKFKDAVKEYMIALKLKANTHKNLGDTYFNQRRFDEAIKEYTNAIRLQPDYYEAHYNLGLVYLEMGLKHKAEEEFKTVLKLKPDFTPAKEALESINGER